MWVGGGGDGARHRDILEPGRRCPEQRVRAKLEAPGHGGLLEGADVVVAQVAEARVLAEELELDRPGRAVSLLADDDLGRSEEHTSELQSLMRISYAVFCLKKKKTK